MAKAIGRGKASAEDRRAERHRQELLRLASEFEASTTLSDEEIEEIRRWEGPAAAAKAIAERNAPRKYTPVSQVLPPAVPVSYGPAPTASTNTMAVLALAFGVWGGLVAIVFGHIALAQIKRTGEHGRGLAVAGLVLSYLTAAVVLLVGLFVATAVISRRA